MHILGFLDKNKYLHFPLGSAKRQVTIHVAVGGDNQIPLTFPDCKLLSGAYAKDLKKSRRMSQGCISAAFAFFAVQKRHKRQQIFFFFLEIRQLFTLDRNL